MALQDEVRDDLEEEVFNEFGKTMILRTITPIYNDYGELEGQTNTDTNIVAVPYNITEDRESYQPFGNLEAGDMDVAIKYSDTITTDDYLVIEGIVYKVKNIQKNFLPDNVVTIVRVSKIADKTAYEAD